MRYIKFILMLSVAALTLAACHKKSRKEIRSNGAAHMRTGTKHRGKAKPMVGSIMDIASHEEDLSTFVRALKKSGLSLKLGTHGSYTVFAPNDSAFRTLPDDFVANTGKAKLAEILKYHIVKGSKKETDLKDGEMLKTLSGNKITIHKVQSGMMVNGAKVIDKNVKTTNGFIHIINKVLTPSNNQ
ncbi:MAG TPA: fasciclin domain-containing protein [Balneolaceae bacterium]|nr:fasciclin domain-containing protein [Balneolaceae bacterium]